MIFNTRIGFFVSFFQVKSVQGYLYKSLQFSFYQSSKFSAMQVPHFTFFFLYTCFDFWAPLSAHMQSWSIIRTLEHGAMAQWALVRAHRHLRSLLVPCQLSFNCSLVSKNAPEHSWVLKTAPLCAWLLKCLIKSHTKC